MYNLEYFPGFHLIAIAKTNNTFKSVHDSYNATSIKYIRLDNCDKSHNFYFYIL